MQKVVSFSGGRTSAYLVWMMEKTKKSGEKIAYVFMDTGAEHQKTYDFVRAVAKHFAVEVICLRVDVNPELGKANGYTVVSIDEIGPDLKPWSDMVKKYGVPYFGGAFCTDRMKLGPFTKYCNEHFGKGNYETWLGIRADEPKRVVGDSLLKKINSVVGYSDEEVMRLVRMTEEERAGEFAVEESCEFQLLSDLNAKLSGGIRYLAEISDFDKQDVLDWWGGQDFDLGIDEWLGNCVFCIKKSDLKLAAAQRDEPGLYLEFLDCISSPSVRTGDRTGSASSMYRRKRSLEQVVAMFDGSTGNEIKSRLRGAKMMDSGSCSESCEVFNCSI